MLWFRLDGEPLGGDEQKACELLKQLDVPYAGIEFGNVVVAVHPSRGVHEDPSTEAELVRKLGEADYRGYWQPTDSEREQLKEIYGDIEARIEQAQERI